MIENITDNDKINEILLKVTNICKLKGLSKETIKAYTYWIKKFLEFCIISSLTPSISTVISYFLTKDNLAYNSMRQRYAAIKFLFTYIYNQKQFNVQVPNVKRPKQIPKVIDKSKIIKMIDGCNNIKHKLIIQILYSSGIRLSERINLKRKQIDFDNNTLIIMVGLDPRSYLDVFCLRIAIRTDMNMMELKAGTTTRYQR